MDMVEELLQSACTELEALGRPELAAEVQAILAKVEALERPEPIEDKEIEAPEDEE